MFGSDKSQLLTLEEFSVSSENSENFPEVNLELEAGTCLGLVGRRGSGRSLFLRSLAGLANDVHIRGRAILNREKLTSMSLRKRQLEGIYYVPRMGACFDRLKLWENLFVSPIAFKESQADRRNLKEIAQDILARTPIQKDIEDYAYELNQRERQWLGLARVFTQNRRLVLLDESTAGLPQEDIKLFYRWLKGFLEQQEAACIYAIPALIENVRICDEFLELRKDSVRTWQASEQDQTLSVQLKITEDAEEAQFPMLRNPNAISEKKRFEIQNLQVEEFDRPLLSKVNLHIKEGEIVGLFGPAEGGRFSLLMSIFGQFDEEYRYGKILVDEEEVDISDSSAAVKRSVGVLSGYRSFLGSFSNQSAMFNMSLLYLLKNSRWSFVRTSDEHKIFQYYKEILRIETVDDLTPSYMLDNNEMQKLLLARCLSVQPKVLLLDSPTRGMTEQGRSQLYHFLREVADAGVSLLLGSSNLAEQLGFCDRIYVMNHGEILGEFQNQGLQKEDLLLALRTSR